MGSVFTKQVFHVLLFFQKKKKEKKKTLLENRNQTTLTDTTSSWFTPKGLPSFLSIRIGFLLFIVKIK